MKHVTEIPYIDRLAKAQWFERWGFIIFAVVGCVGIVVSKVALDATNPTNSLIVSGGAVAVMLLYAFIVWRAMKGRIRADQAGDNLYYLGLLYTLSGLAYAIFTFRPGAKSDSIVEGFGIALATTIAGLMLRVFFNQVRADLVEIEDRARIELTEAATALKSELNQIVVEMNDFGRLTRQSLKEAVDGVEAGMINTIKEAGTKLAKMSTTAEEKVLEAFGRLDGCADELVGSTKEVSAAISEHAAAAKKASLALEKASTKADTLAEATERLDTFTAKVAEQAEKTSGIQTSIASTAMTLSQQTQALAGLVGQMTASIQGVGEAYDRRLAQLEQMPTASAEKVSGLLNQIEARANEQLAVAAAAGKEAVQAHVQALREAVATMTRLNESLAAELQKTQGYQTRVQDGIVRAVDQLTDHVNGNGNAR